MFALRTLSSCSACLNIVSVESKRTKSTLAERLVVRLFVQLPETLSDIVSVTAIVGVENVLLNFVVVEIVVASAAAVVVIAGIAVV